MLEFRCPYKLHKKEFSETIQFSTGILLFKNCSSVENIFSRSRTFSWNFIQQFERNFDEPVHPFSRSDQPTINFLLNDKRLVEIDTLKEFAINNPNIDQQFLISHFPGIVGNTDKPSKVFAFLMADCRRNEFSDVIDQLQNSPLFDKLLNPSIGVRIVRKCLSIVRRFL